MVGAQKQHRSRLAAGALLLASWSLGAHAQEPHDSLDAPLSYEFGVDFFLALFGFDSVEPQWVAIEPPTAVEQDFPTLLYETSPPLEATLSLVRMDDANAASETGEVFRRERLAPREILQLSPHERILLVASADADGLIFSHWEIDGERQAERQRMAPVTVTRSLRATAVYGPPMDGGPGVATISITATPRSAAAIDIISGSERVARIETEGELRMLSGETFRAVAPVRRAKLAFWRWSIDGRPQTTDAVSLDHTVASDADLVAEYARLGDMNGDDILSRGDVELFILSLAQPSEYERRFPGMNRERRADVNGDGSVNQTDIDAFVELLLGE